MTPPSGLRSVASSLNLNDSHHLPCVFSLVPQARNCIHSSIHTGTDKRAEAREKFPGAQATFASMKMQKTNAQH